MAVFAAIRGQHLCVPDPQHCSRRGGETSEVRETIYARVEQPLAAVLSCCGWAGLSQHPCLLQLW